MAMEPSRTPLHRAMVRPNLMAGCERELLLSTGLVAALLIVVAFNWVAAVLGGLVWVFGVAGLRAMAKADPLMSRVYVRHVRYRAYYPARSCPGAPSGTHRR